MVGIFGKTPAESPENRPIRPIDDTQIIRASELMDIWNHDVGSPDVIKRVCTGIYTAAGVEHPYSLSLEGRIIGWRWLLAVAKAAFDSAGSVVTASAEQASAHVVVTRIFTFTWMWNFEIVPNLSSEDYLSNLCLPRAPDEIAARLAVLAMPHLMLGYGAEWDQPVFANKTGSLPARTAILGGAHIILDYLPEGQGFTLPDWITPEQYAQAKRLASRM